jgi:hypothetical protein
MGTTVKVRPTPVGARRFRGTALFGWLAGVLLLAASGVAGAQVLYGSITGNVTDPQGGVMPGVTLTATNTGTGLKVETVTDENGAYTFRNLLPGTYEVTASLTGFREHRESGVAVTAGNPVRVNVTLAVGALTEVVQVTSERTLLQTDKSDLHTELTSQEVTNLPLNQYRNYQALMNLVPGATPVQEQNNVLDTPGRSLRTWVNGTQPNSNTTRVDGAVSVNIWLPHHVGYVQPAETIETVNVATNSFDAEYGMAAGAASTVVTKSGTNELRGSAFVFRNQDEWNANSFNNNAFGLPKDSLSRNTYGGTVGGPVLKNKFFYFGSVERFKEDRALRQNLTVPTDRMRNGDFTEVADAYPTFRLFNPFTGGPGGTNREEFTGFTIPSGLISPIAREVMKFYPAVNSTRDINSNGLLDDFTRTVPSSIDRDNYDVKLTWQRNGAHSLWGKFATLQADVINEFHLGFDQGSLGDTRVYVATAGHTWTLSPTLILDGNFGANIQNQEVTGPDFGTNYGLDLGIPGTNDPNDVRASGLPRFNNGYNIGTTPNWMPLFRKERSYTFSSALTKVFPNHDLRLGVDVVHHQLNHRQAEFGDYGLRGGFGFGNNTTGAAGYISPGWNNFASFLLGLPDFYSKDVQTEDMTGREWQTALYVQDRWAVSNKMTVSAGLRAEYYPLMSRVGRGIERLDYSTYTVLLGGLGDVPEDVGIDMKTWYLAPRVGAMYRLSENQVLRAGYGRTINPLPWSRPMRGSFPYDINFNASAEVFSNVTTLAQGIPTVPVPDLGSGRVRLPQGVFMRSPNPNDVDRGIVQQWNIAYEYRWPWDIATEFAYVGTRTDGGYADLNINYGEPGGGNASRQFFEVAGTTAINDWASRTRSRYHGLQISVNRPFQNGLLLKGAYTLSRAKNMADEDGWVGLDYNHPLVFDWNYALAGFDRTHVAQLGFVWALPFLQDNEGVAGKIFGGWQVNGIASAYSGTPYSIGGTNNALNCPSCGSIRINVSGDPEPAGQVGSATEAYYPLELFSQPTGVGIEGFGNSGRNRFRRPPVWNVDLSLFKTFAIGRLRPEFRLETANVFNHPNWGAPVTTFTANNFLRFTPGSVENGTNSPGARRVQMALRFQF